MGLGSFGIRGVREFRGPRQAEGKGAKSSHSGAGGGLIAADKASLRHYYTPAIRGSAMASFCFQGVKCRKMASPAFLELEGNTPAALVAGDNGLAGGKGAT
jgi:hypothetical protein